MYYKYSGSICVKIIWGRERRYIYGEYRKIFKKVFKSKWEESIKKLGSSRVVICLELQRGQNSHVVITVKK